MRETSWGNADYGMLHESALEFALAESHDGMERWRAQRRLDPDFWLRAAASDLLLRGVPSEYGGGGGTVVHDFVVLDALIRTGFSPASMQVHNVVVPNYLVRYGTAEQRSTWLPEMAAGRRIGALAISEPGTGSDLQALRTTALLDGDDYVLNGAKTFVTNGSTAGLIIAAASTDPVRRGKGVSLFLVDAHREGFSAGAPLEKMGQHDSDTAELVFRDLRVPAAALLGREGDGFAMLMGQLPEERMLVGVTATAAMEHALEMTVRYANERRTFGKPLIEHQHVRFELAECATLVRVARAFLDDCIVRLLDGSLDEITVSMVKWWFSDMEGQVVDRCLQLFGGYGYLDEHPISRLYTAARAQRIYGGTNEIMKEIIGRSLASGARRSSSESVPA